MEDNKWIQIKVTSGVENLDSLCAVMSMLSNGLQIEDYSDIEDRILDGVYGDLIDESVLNADRTVASVSIYVPADKPTEHYTMFIKEKLDALVLHGLIPSELTLQLLTAPVFARTVHSYIWARK